MEGPWQWIIYFKKTIYPEKPLFKPRSKYSGNIYLRYQSITQILIKPCNLNTLFHQWVAPEKLHILLDAIDDDLFLVFVTSTDERQSPHGLAVRVRRGAVLPAS